MATFPGDMHIGWGFGLEPQEEDNTPYEPPFNPEALLAEAAYYDEVAQKHLTDPLLAVSELEQRIQVLESYIQADPAFLPYGNLEKRIDDLEERFRSLTIVVNELVEVSEVVKAYFAEGPSKRIHSLVQRTEILARNAGISFTDDLEEKE